MITLVLGIIVICYGNKYMGHANEIRGKIGQVTGNPVKSKDGLNNIIILGI